MTPPAHNPRAGNGSTEDGLTKGQKFEVTGMIDEKVEKSENRVLAAIEGLKSDMSDFRTEIRAEVAELRSDVKTLTKDVADIKVDFARDLASVRTEVGNHLRTQTWVVVGLVVAMLPAMAGVMAWLGP